MPRSAPVDGFALAYERFSPKVAGSSSPPTAPSAPSAGTSGAPTPLSAASARTSGAPIATSAPSARTSGARAASSARSAASTAPSDTSAASGSVILLHGWPGDRHDWDEVVPLLAGEADVITCDLRGFGESDKLSAAAPEAYAAAAQARSILGLIDELDLSRVVLAGYDVGSRLAQTLARTAPDSVHALVVAPPLPGPGRRVLEPEAQREFWYQPFHQLQLSTDLLDGSVPAVRTYLEHFWNHWSGPSYEPAAENLDRLAAVYGEPGAFTASLGWYRAGSGTVATSLAESPPARADRIATPTTVLWPAHDPLFPFDWSDHLDDYFSNLTLHRLENAGHFSPLEAPSEFASAIRTALSTPR